MKRTRGIAQLDLLIYAGIAIAVLLACWALVHAVDAFVTGAETRGYERGQKATEAIYAQRDNAALLAAQARVKVLQTLVDQVLKDHAAELRRIADAEFNRGVANAENRARNAAGVAAGNRLRDPGRSTACTAGAGGPAAGAPGAAAGVRNGAPGAELSGEATEFLQNLADDADDVAKQLASAQAVIRAQLKACNAP